MRQGRSPTERREQVVSLRATDERYRQALEYLVDARPRAAESVLAESLCSSPRAAQSIYLLGVSLLVQGRVSQARGLIDRAYAVKPWLRDLSPAQYDLSEHAIRAISAEPDWLWPRYEVERNAFFSLSLTLETIVERHLDSSDVYFIPVGANDGKDHDPLYAFVERYNWKGIAIEPVPQAYRALAENYSAHSGVRCIEAALTDRDGETQLFVGTNTKLSSLVPDRNALRSATQSASINVSTISFPTLLERYDVTHVDLLQIDTEGYNFELSAGLIWADIDLLPLTWSFIVCR